MNLLDHQFLSFVDSTVQSLSISTPMFCQRYTPPDDGGRTFQDEAAQL